MQDRSESAWDGRIVAINKPPGISSFRVVEVIRQVTGIKRVGHGGTLDPFAEGVLVVGIGRSATRQLGGLLKGDKEYLATVILGVVTDTFDPTGKVTQTNEFEPPTNIEIETALAGFRGDIMQQPPRFSAVKVNGERLYKAARRGRMLEAQPRKITISTLEMIDMTDDRFRLRVECSHGTYIRSLAHDIGQELGCGAHLGKLVRTRVGEYCLEDAVQLNDFNAIVNAVKETA